MSCHVISCYVMLCHAMSCDVMSCHVKSCHVMSCHVKSCHVISCYALICHVMSCNVMLCHVLSCYVMLCHVMSCYVMLCHVMSCNVMLCHAMSWQSQSMPKTFFPSRAVQGKILVLCQAMPFHDALHLLSFFRRKCHCQWHWLEPTQHRPCRQFGCHHHWPLELDMCLHMPSIQGLAPVPGSENAVEVVDTVLVEVPSKVPNWLVACAKAPELNTSNHFRDIRFLLLGLHDEHHLRHAMALQAVLAHFDHLVADNQVMGVRRTNIQPLQGDLELLT